MMNAGKRLRQLREAQGLTLRELANVARLSPSTISKLENGKSSNPRHETLRRVAYALGCAPEDILGEGKLVYVGRGRNLRTMLREISEAYEQIASTVIPVIGSVPAGTPLPEEQRQGEFVLVPEHLLGGARNPFIVRASGNSLLHMGIRDGENLIIDPSAEFVPGKIYIVEINGEVAARTLTTTGGMPEGATIQGRVIAYGNWNRC